MIRSLTATPLFPKAMPARMARQSTTPLSASSADRLQLRFGASRARIEHLFLEAARKGDKAMVLGFLQAGHVKPDCTDDEERSAAFLAACNGHRELVEILHVTDTDPDAVDPYQPYIWSLTDTEKASYLAALSTPVDA